jgi:hypothetical protein
VYGLAFALRTQPQWLMAWALFVFVALAGGIVGAASFFTGTAASAIGIARCMFWRVRTVLLDYPERAFKEIHNPGGNGVGSKVAARDSSKRASRIGI